MVKKKKTKRVIIKSDKKGRYIILGKRKHYLFPQKGITERELIMFIINRFHRRRKHKGKPSEKKQKKSFPAPSAADSWASGSTPDEVAKSYAKAVLNNKLSQLENTKKLLEGSPEQLALPAAIEDALVEYKAHEKKPEKGKKRLYIKGEAYDLPEKVYDEFAKVAEKLMKQHEQAVQKAEEEKKKREDADSIAEEEKKKREDADSIAEMERKKTKELEKKRENEKVEDQLKKKYDIIEDAIDQLKQGSQILKVADLEKIGSKLKPPITRTQRVNGIQVTLVKKDLFEAIEKRNPSLLSRFILRQIEEIKKKKKIEDNDDYTALLTSYLIQKPPPTTPAKPPSTPSAKPPSTPTKPPSDTPPPFPKSPPPQLPLPSPFGTPNQNLHIHVHPPTIPVKTSNEDEREPESEPPSPEPGTPATDADKQYFGSSDDDAIYRMGGKGYNDGLYTEQIDKIMKRYSPIYVGAIPRDYIKKLAPITRKQKEIAAVINLDNSKQKGSHWISLYINGKPEGSQSVEVFDSFGRPTPKDMIQDIKKVVDSMKLNTYLKFKENRVPVQSAKSSNCGYFSMRFLIDRFRGKSFADASGYTEPKPKVVNKNEKQIEVMKKQAPFSYI